MHIVHGRFFSAKKGDQLLNHMTLISQLPYDLQLILEGKTLYFIPSRIFVTVSKHGIK
jgi:hypothetical protein